MHHIFRPPLLDLKSQKYQNSLLFHEIKVLLSNGYSIDGRAQEILERGCNGFIKKPFNIEQLSRKMKKVLDKK